MEGLLEGGGTRNASTRVAGKVGWPVNWWPTLLGRCSASHLDFGWLTQPRYGCLLVLLAIHTCHHALLAKANSSDANTFLPWHRISSTDGTASRTLGDGWCDRCRSAITALLNSSAAE